MAGSLPGRGRSLVREKRKQFPSVGPMGVPGLRVGLAWAGNPKYKADAARSMRLETLVPLLRAVDANWISLQKGEAAGQLASLPGDVFVADGSSSERDLAETAALVATLDLVVTTDTCIAHLAGAMGKPVWILLPHLADWRWMEGRSDAVVSDSAVVPAARGRRLGRGGGASDRPRFASGTWIVSVESGIKGNGSAAAPVT